MKYKLFALLLVVSTLSLKAQSNVQESIMADTMRGNGKIYVVIAVVLTILSGLLLYVYRLDKKITKLENND